MKKFTAFLLAFMLCLSLAACSGSSSNKQPAIDAFNNASAAYDALVDKINPNIDSYDQEFIDIMRDMGDALTEHKNILESNQKLTEEEINQVIEIFGQVEAWAKETDSILDDFLVSESSDGYKQSVIELFNSVSEDFNAMTAKINANIDAYDELTIDVMTQMANALNECAELLNSDAEFSAEYADMLMSTLSDINDWVKEADAVLTDGAGNNAGVVADKQAAIAAFKVASDMFNSIADEINAHIEDFPQEIIDGMNQMAEGLNAYNTILESDTELTQQEIDEIIEICEIVQQWALDIEDYVFG